MNQRMKKLPPFFIVIVIAMMFISCGGGKTDMTQVQEDSVCVDVIPDTTVYGTCSSGTSMHSLELVTDEGKTLTYIVDVENENSVVMGGMLAGDRMAVVGNLNGEGELVANKVINITTLLGKWTSIDKLFEIQEGGTVESSVKAESHPWTSWKIYNCNLILNTDTFSIESLGADSLFLENEAGIYAFKRQRQQQ